MVEIDIANNIKAVELLKVELLQKLANLYGNISAEADSESDSRIAHDAADIIIMVRLLCRRLGVDYATVYTAMQEGLRQEIKAGHILERRFGDLSGILDEMREDNTDNEKY